MPAREMTCPSCSTTYRAAVRFCPRCGQGLVAAENGGDGAISTLPVVPVAPASLDRGIVHFDSQRTRSIRRIGDVIQTRDMISAQSSAVSSWFVVRGEEKGMSIRQEVSTGGRLCRRTLRATIVIQTW